MAEADEGAATFGLDDAALAVRPTVYAPDAFAGRTVLILSLIHI